MPENGLPEGWESSVMGDVSAVIGGGTPKTSVPGNFAETGHAWITPADLSDHDGLYIARGQRCLTDQGLRTCSARLIPTGAVLMSSRAPIGYLAIAANEVCTNQGFKSFVCPDGLTPEYAYYWLKFTVDEIQAMGGGSTFTEISGSRCRTIPIDIAPTTEQKRIVAMVEKLLARVNTARERLAKVIEDRKDGERTIPSILKRFRQSVLAAACSGRLTADWRDAHPDIEPSSQLFTHIRRERRRLWELGIAEKGRDPCNARYPQIATPNPDFAAELPDAWAVASMDQLTLTITSGSRGWKKYYADDGPGTFIMAQNVRPLRLDRSYRLGVNPPPDDRDRERSQVHRGDILVTIVGANTGDVCRVPQDFEQHYVCQGVALMRPVLEATSPFLELWLNSPYHGQAQYDAWIYGEGRPHLSFDHLHATAVALPPLEEQHEIVRRVEALFRLADTIEQRVTAAKQRADKLTQAILAKAFRGELVPTEAELARQENRDYEPASVLLERINAESNAETKKSRPRRQHAKSRRRQRRP